MMACGAAVSMSSVLRAAKSALESEVYMQPQLGNAPSSQAGICHFEC